MMTSDPSVTLALRLVAGGELFTRVFQSEAQVNGTRRGAQVGAVVGGNRVAWAGLLCSRVIMC